MLCPGVGSKDAATIYFSVAFGKSSFNKVRHDILKALVI